MIYLHWDSGCGACHRWHQDFAAALEAAGAPWWRCNVTRADWPEIGPDDYLLHRFNETCQRRIKLLYPLLIRQFGERIWPCRLSAYYYDDKLRQLECFRALNIPYPETAYVRDAEEAHEFLAAGNPFPLVRKLRRGSGSKHVSLVHRLGEIHFPCLLQRLVPDCSGDYRVTVIGDRIFCAIRRNRPNDFRASGSGIWEIVSSIPPEVCRIAGGLCAQAGFHSMSFDFVCDPRGRWLLLEMSYTSTHRSLDGHVTFYQNLRTGDRVEGPVNAAALIVNDLLSGNYPCGRAA